jgi:5-methyltetrahydrofolate--homocysteine methyltransferase
MHLDYLAAGVDIIETNTFNSTRVSLRDYGMQELALRDQPPPPGCARTPLTSSRKRIARGRVSSPAAIGPTTRQRQSRPTSTTPAFRNVASTRWCRLHGDARAASSTAARTWCWSRRFSTR